MNRTPTLARRGMVGPVLAYISAVAVMLAAAVGFAVYIDRVGIKLEKEPIYPESGETFHSIPSKLPERNPVWEDTGRRDPMSAEVEETLGTDNHVTRYYEKVSGPLSPEATGKTGPGPVVQLHVAYYTGGIDTVPHVPERCFVGGGLTAVGGATLVNVPLDTSRLVPDIDHREATGETIYLARKIEVPNRVRLPRGIDDLQIRVTEFDANGQRVFAGYFFVANGSIITSAEQVRNDAFNLKQDFAYYTKVQFMSWNVDSAEQLGVLAGSMLDEIFGELMHRMPDWIDVEQGLHPAQAADD